jgi:hypothetical protein
MRYEFDRPFLLDSSKITRRLGVTPTLYGGGLAATVAAYRVTSRAVE